MKNPELKYNIVRARALRVGRLSSSAAHIGAAIGRALGTWGN
jgi:hypothetical protein